MIITTNIKAINNVFHISKILAFMNVLRSNAIPNFNPSGKVFWISFILFFILFDNYTVEASDLA